MNGWEFVTGVIASLVVNEMTEVSPWAARKLVRWSAYRWSADPDIAARYAEEWAAIIEERPGKLFKLFTAMRFTIGAAGRTAPRMFATFRQNADRYLTAAGVPRRSTLRWSYLTTIAASGGVVVLTVIDIIGGVDRPHAELMLPTGGILYGVAEMLWRLGHGLPIWTLKRSRKSSATD
ncbi:hypothetical protein AB0F59_27665 [Micromonospora lupini]|uniref:hypothetical protein n=1 Tax=Micromonospora lupini TaxID=285679 RepID=UPI00340F1391